MCQVTMVFYNFRFEDLKIDCKKRSNMTKCQKWKFNSRRGFYLCYWIIRVIFDTSQKLLDKWMSGIDFHGFLLVEVVITLHIMGFWMGLTSNNSLHISSPSKSGKRNVLFWFKMLSLIVIETGDRLGSSWFRMSHDKFECRLSLGHT